MCIFCLSAKAFKDIVNYLFHLIISIVLVLVVVLVMTIGRIAILIAVKTATIGTTNYTLFHQLTSTGILIN